MAALAPGPRRAGPSFEPVDPRLRLPHVRRAVELSRSNRLLQLEKGLLTDWLERGPVRST